MALDSIPLVDTFEKFFVDDGDNIPGYKESKMALEMKEKAELLKRQQIEKEEEEAKIAAIELPKPAFTATKPFVAKME